LFFSQKTQLKPVLMPLPSQSSYSHGPALLCLINVPHCGHMQVIFLMGKGVMANGGGVCDGGALLLLVFAAKF
jgi:hypothetical protein